MIKWILGRSGAGKTTYLKEQLSALAGQYDCIYYLVPEQGSMALERELGAAERVKPVSFRRLCNEIFRRFGGVAGNYMSSSRETALIYRVLEQQQGKLGFYKSVRPSMGFVGRLKEVFSEFALSGLREEQVLPLLEQNGRQDWLEKYRDLFLLYRAYQSALNEENRAAAEDLAAATALAEEQGFFEQTAVLIDGFFGFTGSQRALLEIIFRQSPAVFLALLYDPADPALCFQPAREELAALQRLAQKAGAAAEEIWLGGESKRLCNEELKHLERHFFGYEQPPKRKAEQIRLIAGQNMREELSIVAMEIAKKVREQGLRYRDFALLAGNLEDYGAVAETVFAKYGVPLFLDRGRPSMGKPLFSFVQSALRLISPERYFRLEDLMIFLKTGLCGEEADLISRLENFCKLWQIEGERLIRDADWTQNPAGLGRMKEEQQAQLEELNRLRRRIRTPLIAFKERAAAGTGAALAEAVYQLLCDFKVQDQIRARAEAALEQSARGANAWESQQNRRLSREYLKVFAVMADILDDIYAVFGEEKISLYAMEELIGLCGEEAALTLPPPTLDAVILGEVAHSRPGEVEELYIVGANHGLLPMPVSDRGLIGDRERRLFAEHQLPCNATLRQNTLQGQYRFYAALFNARQRLTFSYAAFTASGESCIRSSYLQRLEQLFEIEPILAEQLPLYDCAVTPDGARDLMAVNEEFRAAVAAELGDRPLPQAAPPERLPQEIAKEIFGRRMELSYSQISAYQKCPFRYFMQNTMDLKEQRPVTFDFANIGTFIHYGLEQLILKLQKENFDYAPYTRDKIQEFGEQMAEEYLGDQLRDLHRTNQFEGLYRRMVQNFCRVAENVLGELREGGYRPYGAEVPLRGTVTLPLSDGGEVSLIGSVDRLDTFEAEGKTYLKVTDYKTGNQKFDPIAFSNRINVQLPIYLYGLIKSGNWPKAVPAAGCYMEAKVPAFKEPFEPEKLEEKISNYYRRGGFYSADPTALAALDSASGKRYFSLDYTKDNTVKLGPRIYSPEAMGEMIEHMEKVLKETAEEIRSGNIAAMPLQGKNFNGCDYCDYAAICRYDPLRSPHREYIEDPEGWREEAEQ